MRYICRGYCARDEQLLKLQSLKNLNTADIILCSIIHNRFVANRCIVTIIAVELKHEYYEKYKMRFNNEKNKLIILYLVAFFIFRIACFYNYKIISKL